MARSLNEAEKAFMNRLENEYPKLKNDKDHRNAFHRYLEDTYIRGVDKPFGYEELKAAYLEFRSLS